jgi:mono/diheme cytochrome c family protein
MRILATIAVIGIVLAILAAVFFFGGFYNVAASQEDPGFVRWALVKVRNASIARHATDRAPGNLGDPAAVQAGARQFLERGCANCHGAPGFDWAKFSEGLHPDPPDLKEEVEGRTPAELFWIVKNGINMTGMPSFGAIGVGDDDIWKIVAFLKQLPHVSDADYKSWTAGASAAAAAPKQ